MTLIPHRTVASQIAAQLRTEITKGTWSGWLPGERSLCETVQASRNTVRVALEQLKAEGLIETSRGLGNRIVAVPTARAIDPDQPKSVGVIIPEPIGGLRPLIALWLDELKDVLLQEGCRLRVHDGQQFYQTNPNRALERLVGQHRHDAWVLTLSSEAMQRWFARRAVPCLVAGSVYPEVALPFLDLDYRAVCRHAAGVLLRHGHTQLALLNRESRRAGDVDSERGFLETVRGWPRGEACADVAYHRDDVDSVGRALHRLLEKKTPPTGLLVSNTYAFLATVSLLAQRGLRIPQDISVISRDDDPFLRALAPEPARYVVSPHAFAKRLLAPLLQLIHREPVARPGAHLLPKFVAGGSVAGRR